MSSRAPNTAPEKGHVIPIPAREARLLGILRSHSEPFFQWFDRPPVAVAERLHLRALQGVQAVIVVLFLISEIRRVAEGMDRLANAVAALAAVCSFVLLRRGRFRLSVLTLVTVFTGAMAVALVSGGIEEQFAAVRYVVFPQILAGLLLGAGALWAVTGVLTVAIIGSGVLAVVAAGRLETTAQSPFMLCLLSLLFVLLVALLVDRVGASLRRHLHLALDREEEARQARRDLQQSYEQTLQSLSAALDLRDRETQGHSTRVVELSVLLGAALGLDEVTLRELRWGALLHDVGKIGVPDSILHKPGPLNEGEWSIVRRHPRLGHDILREVAFLEPALDVVLHHHERWDGSGYPTGLKGESIPIAARVFSVVDAFDAMASERVYREALPLSEVRERLQRMAGRELDPAVVQTFLRLDTDLLTAIQTSADPSPATALDASA